MMLDFKKIKEENLFAACDVLRRFSHPYNSPVWFFFNFALGLYFGYPVCCVLAYCSDAFLFFSHTEGPLLRRKLTQEEKLEFPIGYIPCNDCFIKLKKERLNGSDISK